MLGLICLILAPFTFGLSLLLWFMVRVGGAGTGAKKSAKELKKQTKIMKNEIKKQEKVQNTTVIRENTIATIILVRGSHEVVKQLKGTHWREEIIGLLNVGYQPADEVSIDIMVENGLY